MVFRLVLGCGTVGRHVVTRLAERDSVDDRLLVVTDDESVVETLRDESIPARQATPNAPDALENVEPPDVVFVGGDRTDVNRTTLETAREQFSDAEIVAYLGGNPTPGDRAAFDTAADCVVDTEAPIVDAVLERTTTPVAKRVIQLRRQLESIDGRLAVVMHNNPDPDAIGSAVALVDIAESVALEVDPCYFGEISHQENRAMVNLLDLDLRNLDSADSLEEYDAFALVDHSRPGVNDDLPADLQADIVIDHHPPRGPVPGEFVDLREGVGATSTVLTEYVDRFSLPFDSATATALLYGIRVDTNDFSREVSSADFEAASILRPHADVSVLRQIEQPTIEGETLETIARAIKNRELRDSAAVASVGRITNRDALPQAAEQLLAMEDVETTLVFGFRDETAYLSARSRANDIDLGETLRDAFDQIGSAGGHADMAGAQLEVGILTEVDDCAEADSIVSVVEEVIRNRFFEGIRTRPGVPVGTYDRTSEWLFTFSPPGDELEDESHE
ncbi:DHH family phosphoesterase [Natronobacterium gregoryi]|uniref:DHH family phosphoesterase n=3 Tax=cellular organisms TaxID=131567 RepID=L0AE47_NATGS|nr:DHH family phosphoesterase [Natronobacterium gregoryi]AFZ72096.1 exopolyphosphatase-like enzyme [Natronobacterium gregoryi SP2]ELY62873.1 phosphoesterase RecJ domain-containing protein [Natronobacterium gregoryi SP2]PLK20070.1 DHH family phosphoesterase [Natronobacterium gregoryi SP2]SFJ58126.1 nanoRNase/pAp phosphatase, hydrolyzes c-di-AMP and oligoRNAs [Natronobacterium gregoryi]